MPIQIKQFVEETGRMLTNVSDSPHLDAQVLTAGILGQPRTWLLAHPDAPITEEQQARLLAARCQLVSGIPLPYVLGHWEFFSLDFIVTPDVLIPRPETELLVETALHWLAQHPLCRTGVDVGTGSGCIAISLVINCPHLQMTGVDFSAPALAIARQNLQRHNVAERVNLVQGDLLTSTTAQFPLICANLPYIPLETLKKCSVFGREPTAALDGGADGLDLIRRLIDQAKTRLSAPGLMLLEIEASQGQTVRSLAERAFRPADILIIKDLAGLDRLVAIELQG
jgi:release factor glutamine methyltransferase